ncbi:MAG: hypothetical protein RL701_8060 [Pseudomonadota bacterium]
MGASACQGEISDLPGSEYLGGDRPGSGQTGASGDGANASNSGASNNGNVGGASGSTGTTNQAGQAGDACANVVDVADAPLRRLTGIEFDRSVADVFGVTGGSEGLAIDERIDGVFASNLTSAVVPVQVRQYLDAAESIAARVKVLDINACDRGKTSDEACARQYVERIGRRAYRRALQTDEIDQYVNVYKEGVKLDGHELALRLVTQTMLQSPHFLYHLEVIDTGATVSKGTVRVSNYALASRLSYFLWSSAPDDTLLDAAKNGELATQAGLEKQLNRMLDDARASHGIEAFHTQWLGLMKLDTASRDPQLFPEWNPELVTALRTEVVKFSDYVVRDQKGTLSDLLTARYSFPTGPGLAIRGVKDSNGDKPLDLDAKRSLGLLTQPAFLASFSHSNQTSPILRGRALRERFFCQPLPDPPPNVAAVAPELSGNLTTRERYALHRTAGTSCVGCHALIDDLGFALEHYDPLGRYRETENGKAIDATGKLTNTDVDGSMDGAAAMAERMSSSKQVQSCYATQWFRYAIGRSERDADKCSLQRIEAVVTGSSKVRDLMISIAKSDAFVRQRAGK